MLVRFCLVLFIVCLVMGLLFWPIVLAVVGICLGIA